MGKALYTYQQASRMFAVRPETISDIVRAKSIPVKPHPANGSARAIDDDGIQAISECLGRPVNEAAAG